MLNIRKHCLKKNEQTRKIKILYVCSFLSVKFIFGELYRSDKDKLNCHKSYVYGEK